MRLALQKLATPLEPLAGAPHDSHTGQLALG
jgi:hypothetical protein